MPSNSKKKVVKAWCALDYTSRKDIGYSGGLPLIYIQKNAPVVFRDMHPLPVVRCTITFTVPAPKKAKKKIK